jgi:hypothetical protein
VRKIQDRDAKIHVNIEFLVVLGDGAFDGIFAYGTYVNVLKKFKMKISSQTIRSGHLLISWA